MTTYKITDEAKLKASFPQFLKTKTVTVKQEISILDQQKVRFARKAGIEVPGISEDKA